MVNQNKLQHEVRNAILGIEANKIKMLKLMKAILEVIKDIDKHLERIEEAIKDGNDET